MSLNPLSQEFDDNIVKELFVKGHMLMRLSFLTFANVKLGRLADE